MKIIILSLRRLDVNARWDNILQTSKTVLDTVDTRFNHSLKIQFPGDDILVGTFITNIIEKIILKNDSPISAPPLQKDLYDISETQKN